MLRSSTHAVSAATSFHSRIHVFVLFPPNLLRFPTARLCLSSVILKERKSRTLYKDTGLTLPNNISCRRLASFLLLQQSCVVVISAYARSWKVTILGYPPNGRVAEAGESQCSQTQSTFALRDILIRLRLSWQKHPRLNKLVRTNR